MEQILIEVNDEVAKMWQVTSENRKKELMAKINTGLEIQLSDNQKQAIVDHLNILRDNMQERGLTESLLIDLLDEK